MSAKKVSTGFGAVEIYEIDGIPFRKFNSLLQHEVEWFESRSDSRIASIKSILELAKQIAIDKNMAEDEALQRVEDLENEDNKFILMEYADRLDKIKSATYTETHFKRDVATMLLNSRIPKRFIKDNLNTLSESFDIELDPEELLFDVSDVQLLPSNLIDKICNFCTKEKLEWKEEEVKEPSNQPETLGE